MSEFLIAIHALVYLGHRNEPLTSEELAENICVNPVRVRTVLKAFIDTQRRSLDVANLLLKKHESSLIKDEETKTKAEKEKRAKEQAIKSKTLPTITQQPKQSAENEEVGLFDTLQGDDKI